MEIRRFTRDDWYGWAGTRFGDKSEPFIYTDILDSCSGPVDITIIADAEGLSISLICNNGVFLAWNMDVKLTPLKAEGELRAVIKALEEYTNAADISYALGHKLKPEFKDFIEV